MKELIPTINEIIKFGLFSNLKDKEKEIVLEKNLIKIYCLYFEINYEFDDRDYADYDKTELKIIQNNIKSNFEKYGFYKTAIGTINEIDNLTKCGIGDAIDDLTDIIFDLSEIKWRIENNSENDGLWFFKLIFKTHTQQHILDLLNYMKQIND